MSTVVQEAKMSFYERSISKTKFLSVFISLCVNLATQRRCHNSRNVSTFSFKRHAFYIASAFVRRGGRGGEGGLPGWGGTDRRHDSSFPAFSIGALNQCACAKTVGSSDCVSRFHFSTPHAQKRLSAEINIRQSDSVTTSDEAGCYWTSDKTKITLYRRRLI